VCVCVGGGGGDIVRRRSLRSVLGPVFRIRQNYPLQVSCNCLSEFLAKNIIVSF
jgi:hypothetical protein